MYTSLEVKSIECQYTSFNYTIVMIIITLLQYGHLLASYVAMIESIKQNLTENAMCPYVY